MYYLPLEVADALHQRLQRQLKADARDTHHQTGVDVLLFQRDFLAAVWPGYL